MKALCHLLTWVLFVMLLSLTMGCATMQGRWDKARSTSTIESYEEFLRKYPQGKFSGEARAKLSQLYEERDWRYAVQRNTLPAYEDFLKRYPNSKLKNEALTRVEPLYFDRVRKLNTIQAYEAYLKIFPKGKFADEARSGLSSLHFEDAKSKDSISAYENFLKKYPHGNLSDLARKKLESLYLEKAKGENTVEAYESFLKRYPQGQFADEVRSTLDPLYFERARVTNTIAAYEDFIKGYPQSRFVSDAQQSLQNLKDQIKAVEESARQVLPKEAKVEVSSVSRFPQKPEFKISAHLLEGHSADDNSPYVQGDYGTKEKLTKLIQLRCANILKSIATQAKLPDASMITIEARHGVRQSYFTGGFGGTDVAMTLYQISIPLDKIKERDWSKIETEEITQLWKVDKDILPSIEITTVFR